MINDWWLCSSLRRKLFLTVSVTSRSKNDHKQCNFVCTQRWKFHDSRFERLFSVIYFTITRMPTYTWNIFPHWYKREICNWFPCSTRRVYLLQNSKRNVWFEISSKTSSGSIDRKYTATRLLSYKDSIEYLAMQLLLQCGQYPQLQ